jgi:cation diffusion facilitator CzcD-associated flavoprotein CzcO
VNGAPREIAASRRIAVIGAGPSGLAAAKVLRQAGFRDLVVFEKGDRVGGNWVYSEHEGHSSVYQTTHIISSKRRSGYSDFPMPADYPDYPSHRQLQAYFERYATRFELLPHIRFGAEVVRARKLSEERWRLETRDGSTEECDALLVANGHHWDPRWPTYPGEFHGRLLHSHAFKTAEPFRGQRVLIIGGGNSACDIAVETGRVSAHTGISWRRGYYVVPKLVYGVPPDVLNARLSWLPRPLRRRLNWLTWRIVTGGNAAYGLPEPDHPFLTSHPVVNSELLYFIRHGRITPYPAVARMDGSRVHFADGSAAEFDAIIAATGFRISFPFFDPAELRLDDDHLPLHLWVFHPDHPSLFIVGLVQPMGCIWPLAEAQAELIGRYLRGAYRLPRDVGARIDRVARAQRRRWVGSPRHSIEVDYFEYLGRLRRG